MLLQIILATLLVSAISLIGILVIFKKKNKQSFLKALISLAAGALLTVALLHMLPEAIEESVFDPHLIFFVVLVSIVFFFLLERVFHWHHCHCEEHGKPDTANKKNLALINLVGDGIHNFVDGALIASAFMLDFHAGLMVTLGVLVSATLFHNYGIVRVPKEFDIFLQMEGKMKYVHQTARILILVDFMKTS